MKKDILKRNFLPKLRRSFLLPALFLAAVSTGCERSCTDDPAPGNQACTTEVTVESAGCASGAFQSRWFKLPNGEWLQPFENQTNITSVEPGQRYTIGYEIMKRDNRYDKQVVCLALPPTGKAIRILCMTPMEVPTVYCDTYVTARNVNCSLGAWGNTWLQLHNGHYLQPWQNNTATQTLVEGARYKIGFTPMARDNRYININTCAAMPLDSMAWSPQVVSVNCLEPVGEN
ncbi:hypothetical protein [Adhaeribacter terreus]|uniref:DUF4377 domain-containing protein n=1 Tax=Adhaeribacter terreus TaxID=529703 RepID=A0ABW0EHL5_9BACT